MPLDGGECYFTSPMGWGHKGTMRGGRWMERTYTLRIRGIHARKLFYEYAIGFCNYTCVEPDT